MDRNPASESLLDWVYWMVLDILEHKQIKIVLGYVYVDTKKGDYVVRKRPIPEEYSDRFRRADAKVDIDKDKIFINPEAEDKPLCLFHECLEILFTGWVDGYFKPTKWGLQKYDDPILYLEAVIWGKLTQEQKDRIKSFLPKGP